MKIKIEGLLSIDESVKYLKGKGIDVTGQTLRNWSKKYDFGEKKLSRWYIKQENLDKIISGEINFFE